MRFLSLPFTFFATLLLVSIPIDSDRFQLSSGDFQGKVHFCSFHEPGVHLALLSGLTC